MKDSYIDYADFYADLQDEQSREIDRKILEAVEKGVNRKLSQKEKDRVWEDYACWYDKYTSEKDDKFLKKEISDIKNNIKSKYFPY